jgi:hypothetical protein
MLDVLCMERACIQLSSLLSPNLVKHALYHLFCPNIQCFIAVLQWGTDTASFTKKSHNEKSKVVKSDDLAVHGAGSPICQSNVHVRVYCRGSQSVRRPPPPPGGGSCLYEGHTHFEQNMDARYNTYFGSHFAWLKYCTYHILLNYCICSTFCRWLKLVKYVIH